MKNNKILILIFLIFLFILAGCEISFGDKYDNDNGTYIEDTEEFEGFTNPVKETVKFDEDFKIDGVFDEEEYTDLIWWEEKYVSASDEVKIRITSYFGEKGVFMGFDVDDAYVFVNNLRSSFRNSGLEIYVSRPGATTLVGTTFEIDLLPNNTIHPRLYFNGTYSAYPAPFDKAPFIGTTLKGGAINTSACKGYSMEVYFPYEYLLDSTEKPEYLNVNVALIRATNADKNNNDRLWYNFGEHKNSSYNWGNPETYWKFGAEGLIANRVSTKSNDLGTITAEKSYVTNYSDIKFDITPNANTYLKSLKCNGTDVTDIVKYDEYDNPYYVCKKVTEDLEVVAEFESLSQTKSSLTGMISYNGETLTEEVLNDLYIKYRSNGISLNGSLYKNGTYLLRDLPLNKGIISIYSNEGYEVISKEIDLSTLDGKLDINFTDNEYGPNRTIKIETVESINGARKNIYTNDILTNKIGSNFVYSFNLKYDGKLFDENGILIKDPSYGTHEKQYSAFNLTGNMVNESGTEIGDFNMQIMHWNSNGYWMIKLWVGGKEVNTMLGIDFLRDLNDDGVNLILVNEDCKITVYQSFNDKLFKLIEKSLEVEEEKSTEAKGKESSEIEGEEPSEVENIVWYLSELSCYGDNAMVNSSWAVSESRLTFNKTNSDLEYYGSIRSLDSNHDFKLEAGKIAQTSVCWNSSLVVIGGFTSNIIIPGILNDNNEYKNEPFTVGFRTHLYNDKEEWFGLYIYVYCDGTDYYVSACNSVSEPKTKTKLSTYQIEQLATNGLLVGYYKNQNQVSFFVEGEEELVEIATLDTISTSSWYAGQHDLRYVDLMHNGHTSLGTIYTENTKIYTILNTISLKDFYEMIGGSDE